MVNLVSLFNTATEAVNRIMEINPSVTSIELREANHAARVALLAVKDAMLEQQQLLLERKEEIDGLKVEIQQLKATKAEKRHIEDGCYYFTGPSLDGMDGPYCTVCHDKDALKIRMKPTQWHSHRFRCEVCGGYSNFTGVHDEPTRAISEDYDPLAAVRRRHLGR